MNHSLNGGDRGAILNPMFGARKHVVSPEQREWLENSFALLIELFGRERLRSAPFVLPNQEFFPRKYEQTPEWGRYAFGQVCGLMHVDRDRVDLEFTDDPVDELRQSGIYLQNRGRAAAGTHLGLPVEGAPDRAHITVRVSLLKEPEVMVAVMAHELAHVLLLGDAKIDRSIDRMEPLTDLMTVFCGFGFFNSFSSFQFEQSQRSWRVSRMGYLSEREYGYALGLYAWLRGETKPKWTRELKENVRVFAETTLSIFRAENRPPG